MKCVSKGGVLFNSNLYFIKTHPVSGGNHVDLSQSVACNELFSGVGTAHSIYIEQPENL